MIGDAWGGGGGESLNDSRRGTFLSLLLFMFVYRPISSHTHYTLHLFLCWLNRWGHFWRDNQFVWYSTMTREGSQEEQVSKSDWHRLVWYAISSARGGERFISNCKQSEMQLLLNDSSRYVKTSVIWFGDLCVMVFVMDINSNEIEISKTGIPQSILWIVFKISFDHKIGSKVCPFL